MKIKNILFFLITVLSLWSCEALLGDDFDIICSLKNESNQNIVLELSTAIGSAGDRSIQLPINGLHIGDEVEFNTLIPLENPDNAVPSRSFSADSIVFVFNNERKMSWFFQQGQGSNAFSSPFQRNPLRAGNYDRISDEEFVFTITQEDFENATPCDGPCE